MPTVVDLVSSKSFHFTSGSIGELLDDISNNELIGGPKEYIRLKVNGEEIHPNNFVEYKLTEDSEVTYYYQLNGGAPLDVTSIYTLFGGLFLIAVGACFFIFLGILALIIFYITKCCSAVFGVPAPRKVLVEDKAS